MTAPCRHLAVDRHVGHATVVWTCKGCGRRWAARIVGDHVPEERPT